MMVAVDGGFDMEHVMVVLQVDFGLQLDGALDGMHFMVHLVVNFMFAINGALDGSLNEAPGGALDGGLDKWTWWCILMA